MAKVKILGIEIFGGNLDSLVNILTRESEKEYQRTKLVSATSAHGLVHSTMHQGFRKTLESFNINAPDGMPITWVAKFKGCQSVARCYGPDLFKEFIVKSADTDLRHFLCGGQAGVAHKLKTVCINDFHNDNIVGIHSPPFKDVKDFDYPAIAEEINTSKADIVWIGLSTPKQEEFAVRLAKYANAKLIVTVGAAFDFHIGALRQAPYWVQKIGMEWFFRLMMEPRRLAKRYSSVVPLFIYYNVLELVTSRVQKISSCLKNI